MELIKSEQFNNVNCDMYQDGDNIMLTREQIGTALGYSNPDVALSLIHKRHRDRLDKFSVVTSLISTDGKSYDTYLYTDRGIMEICRWSRQPKANEFMD